MGEPIILLEEIRGGWSIGETEHGEVGYLRTSCYQDDPWRPGQGVVAQPEISKRPPRATFPDMAAKLQVLLKKYTGKKFGLDDDLSLSEEQEARVRQTVAKHYPQVAGMWLTGDFRDTTLREALRKAGLREEQTTVTPATANSRDGGRSHEKKKEVSVDPDTWKKNLRFPKAPPEDELPDSNAGDENCADRGSRGRAEAGAFLPAETAVLVTVNELFQILLFLQFDM